MAEDLLPAWDQAHIQDMESIPARAYPEHWSEISLSYAQAETLVDVFKTPEAAAKRFPQIPLAILAAVMENVHDLRSHDPRTTNDD